MIRLGRWVSLRMLVVSCILLPEGCGSNPCNSPSPSAIELDLPLAAVVANADAGSVTLTNQLPLRPLISEVLLGSTGPDFPSGSSSNGAISKRLLGNLYSGMWSADLTTPGNLLGSTNAQYTEPSTIQLSINDPCFQGASGGVGFSIAATLLNLTDAQCRQSTNGLCDAAYLPVAPSKGLPVSSLLTPATAVCTKANGITKTIDPDGTTDCTYSEATQGTCPVCDLEPDGMGPAQGLFIGLDAVSNRFFARLPESVMATQLPNILVDPISYVLTSGFNGGPPAFFQSIERCGLSLTNACNTTPPFTTLSAWFNDGSPRTAANSNYLAPVAASVSFEPVNGVTEPVIAFGSAISPNLFFLHFHMNPITAEHTQAGEVSVELEFSALAEVIPSQGLPGGPPTGLSCDALMLRAPATVFVSQGSGQAPLEVPNGWWACDSCGPQDYTGGDLAVGLVQTIMPILNAGFILRTPGYCITQAGIQTGTAGSTVDPFGALVGLDFTFGPPSQSLNVTVPVVAPVNGATPAAWLQIEGYLDAGDPPADPPDGGSPIPNDPVTFLPAPSLGQPIEGLGMTYQSAPGFEIEAALLGQQGGGVEHGILAVPLWPVPLPYLVQPKTKQGVIQGHPVILHQPDDNAAVLSQAFTNPFDDYLSEPLDGGVQEVGWPFRYGQFPPANQFPFFYGGILASAAPQVMTAEETVGNVLYYENAIIYSCSAAEPVWTAPGVIERGGPAFASYPIWSSGQSVRLLTPQGSIGPGGIDAGDPPPPPLPTLADYLPPEALQAFAGPVTVQGFAQRERRLARCQDEDGNQDESFTEPAWLSAERERFGGFRQEHRGDGNGGGDGDGNGVGDGDGCGEGRWRDRRGHCCVDSVSRLADPPGDAGSFPPEYGILGDGVLLTNSSGETLALRPSARVRRGAFFQALCGGSGATVQTTLSLPFSEFAACQSCGSPAVSPGAGQCCWTERQVSPAILGLKTVSFDLYEQGAAGASSFINPSSSSTANSYGSASWPSDPDGSYLVGPVGADDGDGGLTSVEELFELPQNDTIFVVGATDRELFNQGFGGPFSQQPQGPVDVTLASQQPIADVACAIGLTSASPPLAILEPPPLLNFCQYVPDPTDQVQVSITLAPPLHVAGAGPVVFDAGYLPFQQQIAAGGGDECKFLNLANAATGILDAGQPAYSVNYHLPDPSVAPGTTIQIDASGPSGGAACGPTIARIDAVGIRSASLTTSPTDGLIVPGFTFAPQTSVSLNAWWTTITPGANISGSVQTILSNGVQLNQDGSTQALPGGVCAPNGCAAGALDQCCLASGQAAVIPLVQDGNQPDLNCCSGTADTHTGICK